MKESTEDRRFRWTGAQTNSAMAWRSSEFRGSLQKQRPRKQGRVSLWYCLGRQERRNPFRRARSAPRRPGAGVPGTFPQLTSLTLFSTTFG